MVRPFPFDRLPRLPRSYPRIVGLVRQHLGAGARSTWERWCRRYLPAGVGAPLPDLLAVEAMTDEELVGLVRGSHCTLALRSPRDETALLTLDGKLTAALMAMLLRGDPAPSAAPLTEGERGLVCYMVAALLHELGESCDWALATRGEQAAAPAASGGWAVLRLRIGLAGLSGGASLALPETLLERQSIRPALGHPGRLRWVGCQASVVLARLVLPAAEVELLGEGDVILSTELPTPSSSYRAWLRAGEGGCPVVVTAGGGVKIAGSLQLGGDAMENNDAKNTQRSAEVLPLTESLPVELVVEIGRLSLTAAQLLELEPGDVLTLERPLTAPLDLRIGDRLVGRAELVDVEGEAGVRLVEVYDGSPP